MARDRGDAALLGLFELFVSSMSTWRPILGFDPGFDPRFFTPVSGFPFWEIAASLGRRAMDTALRRMLFVFSCGAMLSLPWSFSALLPLWGFVNEPNLDVGGSIGSTGALKWIYPKSKDMLAPGTVGRLMAEKRLEPAPEEPMESSKVVSKREIQSGKIHALKWIVPIFGYKRAWDLVKIAKGLIGSVSAISGGVQRIWAVQEATFQVPTGFRWPSVIGTLIWDLIQPPISQGLKLVPMVLAWLLKPQKGASKAVFWITLLVFKLGDYRVEAVCPMCNGYGVGCTWAADKCCPAVDEPTSNRNIITGASNGMISLAKCIPARFLRAFTRAELTAVATIAARPPPGTPVTITAATKLKEISVYLNQGLVSMDQVSMLYAGFIDDESDEDTKRTLMYNLKLLMSMKDLPGVVGAQAEGGEPYGVLTWLLAMVASFVAAGTIVAKTTLGPADASTSSGTGSRHVAKLVRPKTMVDLFELMNLYIMFYTSLGLGSTILITQFFEFVIFDTIRMRSKQWPVAFELLVILLRKVENTVDLTIGNVMQEVYLNSAMEEAVEAAKTYYAAFFRSPQLAAAKEIEPTDGEDKQVKWNNKYNRDSNATPCLAFNLGKEHSARFLKKDGTCKHKHVCDHWVSNKGPGGRCLGTEGTPGHSRADCDNPHRCESKQQ